MNNNRAVLAQAANWMIAVLIATLAPGAVLANSDYQTAFNGKYPTAAGATTCSTCHGTAYSGDLAAEYSRLVGSPAPAGARIAATMTQAITNIESKDSDGDGYTNLSEILLGNLPGDAANKPNLTAPAAPTAVSAVPGNGQATVSFTAGATGSTTGGSTFMSYTVTASPGGIAVSGASSPIVVPGLTNGTAYSFSVAASNGKVGATAASAASSPVTPAAPATVPTAVSALAGNGQATVSFTVPASGGASYTATSIPGGITATGTGSPIIVPGLQNGTSYTFTVAATGAAASLASNAVTPNSGGATVPDAPSALGANSGNGMAVIAISPPANGGSPITAYGAICTYQSGVGVQLSSTFSSPGPLLIITGLSNGTIYNCRLTASNAVGTSVIPFFSSVQFTPTTPSAPSVPTGITAVSGNAQASIAFVAPANDGGSAILDYTAYCKEGADSGFTTSTTTGVASPLTVTGLTNGKTYACWVAARNAQGTIFGLQSGIGLQTASVTPTAITVPALPTGVSAAAGTAQAAVSFTVPTSNGGGPITGYTVTSSPGFIAATGQTSPITVKGLSDGVAYTFTVTATNAAGSSVSLASAAVTISGNPSDCLFNWAERTHPTHFSPAAASNTLAPYYYRYYSQAKAYLGTSSADTRLYYLGPLTNNTLADVGALTTWLATAGCTP